MRAGGATLTFQLLVRDGQLARAPATVTITIRNSNAPPICTQAQASPARLWPPNYQLVPVPVSGLRDPNGHAPTGTVTVAHQDEPLDGQGDGDTSPDDERSSDHPDTYALRCDQASRRP
ncbi:MAG: hypothetical protein FJZ47_07620 [Candidatus Tectomicrobia bacterium]|uniref:RapA2 cadherin-like domain-containing protein n=1 Tax=Tectimicrobiota bacterium TaxID=2528274 RepID=A0A938B201_UNCTE|nr:hypothetical protein [Candidatus Tectomicrobia bacterium]